MSFHIVLGIFWVFFVTIMISIRICCLRQKISTKERSHPQNTLTTVESTPVAHHEDTSPQHTTGTTRTHRSGSVSSNSSNGSGTTSVPNDNNTHPPKHRKLHRKVKYTYRSRKKRRQMAKQNRYHPRADSPAPEPPKSLPSAGEEESSSSATSWTKTWTQCVGHLGEEDRHKKIVVKHGSIINRLARIRKIEDVWKTLTDYLREEANFEEEIVDSTNNANDQKASASKNDWLYGWFNQTNPTEKSDGLLENLTMGFTQDDGTHPEIKLNKFVSPAMGGSISWENVLYIRVETKIVWQRFGVKIKIVREPSATNSWKSGSDQKDRESGIESGADNSMEHCTTGICMCAGLFGIIFILVGLWMFAHFHTGN